MACKSNLVFLSCEYSGVGFTARPVEKGSTRVQLMKGHGNNFPALVAGLHFYVQVESCSTCCEIMRVVGRENDVLIVERGLSDACDCIMSNAKVKYDASNQFFLEDWNNVVPINAQSPLKWDCETNTLSVDCAELFKSGCGGCDCGEGSSESVVETQMLRGKKGDKGDPGPAIVGANVSPMGVLTFTLADGSVVTATGRVPKGPKGDKGDNGPPGKAGDVGPDGEASPKIVTGSRIGNDLELTMSDDERVTIKNAFPPASPVAEIVGGKREGNALVLNKSDGTTVTIANAFTEAAESGSDSTNPENPATDTGA